MSAIFDGSTDAMNAAVTGITYPFTIAMWVKPANAAQTGAMASLGVMDGNFTWCRHAVLAAQMLNRNAFVAADVAMAGVVAADVWKSEIFVSKDNNEKWMFFHGVQSAVTVTDNGALPALNRFDIGAAWRAGANEQFFAGRIAAVSFHTIAADQAFATAHAAGADPSTMAGCTNYFLLEDGAVDSVGSWSMTPVGTPTYDATDNPPIVYGLSPKSLTIPLGRSPGVRLYDSGRIRGRRR
jgi:hypothetical protein